MQNSFYFIGNFSNIYRNPSRRSEVTSQIIYGEKFKILSKNKKWIKIKTSFDNYVGYIKNSKYAEKFKIGGGEGADTIFNPDILISTGDHVSCSSWSMEAIHTPGHMSNHLCFSLNQGEALFSGDLVMGWATTLISPPDGDIGQYKASLNSLLKRKENLYYPGHGAPLKNAKKMVLAQLNHRNERETNILNSISQKGSKINEIVDSVYHDLSDNLKIAASRNVLAHLIHLIEKGLVLVEGDNVSLDSIFRMKK